MSDHPTVMYILAHFSSTAYSSYWEEVSRNRRHIRNELCKLTFKELRILYGVKRCGIAFHNIRPSTADDLSNRVWLAAELL